MHGETHIKFKPVIQMWHGYRDWQWCAPIEHTNVKSVLICTKKKYEVNSRLNGHVRNLRFLTHSGTSKTMPYF